MTQCPSASTNNGRDFGRKGPIQARQPEGGMAAQTSGDPRVANLENAIAQAIRLHRAGRLGEAQQLYEQVLRASPKHFDALYLLGLVNAATGNADRAIALIKSALELNPDSSMALYNLGVIFHGRKQIDEAIDCFRKAVQINPAFAEAYNNLGNALNESGLADEAVQRYEQALSVNPNYAEALNNLGNIFRTRQNFSGAIGTYQKALSINPRYLDALMNLGNVFVVLKRFNDAIETFGKAAALAPGNAQLFNNLGNALAELKRFPEAIASYRQSLEIAPDNADTHYNIGVALLQNSDPGQAAIHLKQVLVIRPGHEDAFGMLLRSAMHACDFRELQALRRDLAARISDDRFFVDPFIFIGINTSPSDELKCAKNFAHNRIAITPAALYRGAEYHHKKIRIAYLSADFHEHATAYLMAELFETHDRGSFEVIGVSFGPDDRSPMRQRLAAAFDRFLDVRTNTDEEVSKLLLELQIDIAIDLKGYTEGARMGIFARRPAPIQVSYLGYPGTTGAPFIDYVIGDRFVTPFEHQEFFTEEIVQLPDSYQVNDSKRLISPKVPTRKECGLPEHGFVFCCFNKSSKILPEVFDVWMRLLHAVDGSVLWLMGENKNLREQAGIRGITPDRLVFAPRASLDEHLARHRLADLFLDTLPYNAHTTASDALWAGLPVITCLGRTFAGRVGASLLNASGMPELITNSFDEYEALARRLALDQEALNDIKEKLSRNRITCPLFDTGRFRAHIEKAYMTMLEQHRRGEPPKAFAVPPR
jgi:protein O-GlcNAc transferase